MNTLIKMEHPIFREKLIHLTNYHHFCRSRMAEANPRLFRHCRHVGSFHFGLSFLRRIIPYGG